MSFQISYLLSFYTTLWYWLQSRCLAAAVIQRLSCSMHPALWPQDPGGTPRVSLLLAETVGFCCCKVTKVQLVRNSVPVVTTASGQLGAAPHIEATWQFMLITHLHSPMHTIFPAILLVHIHLVLMADTIFHRRFSMAPAMAWCPTLARPVPWDPKRQRRAGWPGQRTWPGPQLRAHWPTSARYGKKHRAKFHKLYPDAPWCWNRFHVFIVIYSDL